MRPTRPDSYKLALCLGLSTAALSACGGGGDDASSTAGSTGQSGGESPTGRSAGASGGASASRAPNGRTMPEFSALRPAAGEAALSAITRDAYDSEAHARGALAFATTDVRGMTLFWGQVYRILDTHGRRTVDVANAMAQVIRERFTVSDTGDVEAELAPGDTVTVTGADLRTYAAFAHLYEHSMSMIPNPPSPLDTYEGAAGVILGQLRVTCRQGEPVLPDPTYTWLCELASAGHADAYSHWVIGPAFGPDWEAWRTANAQKLDRFETWTHQHRFQPRRSTRPDDLYPVRGGD